MLQQTLCRCELHGLIRALADDRPAFQSVVARKGWHAKALLQ